MASELGVSGRLTVTGCITAPRAPGAKLAPDEDAAHRDTGDAEQSAENGETAGEGEEIHVHAASSAE